MAAFVARHQLKGTNFLAATNLSPRFQRTTSQRAPGPHYPATSPQAGHRAGAIVYFRAKYTRLRPTNRSRMTRATATAIYLIADLGSGDVKIGISRHPETRAKQIAVTYQVGEIYIAGICWFKTKREALHHERQFHRIYSSRRSSERGGREWFRLSRSEIESFLEGMRLYQEEVKAQRGRYRNKGAGQREAVLPPSRYRNLGVGRREKIS